MSCDGAGVFVGAIPILARARRNGEDEWQPRDCDDVSEEMSAQYGLPVDMSSKVGGLIVIAKALNAGDVARAQIATVLLGIPDPPPFSKSVSSRQRMITLVRDLHWSGMLKWDPDEHPRWPAGAPDSQGGQFAPKGEGGETSATASSARIQLADAGMSDASDDPVAEASARTADAAPADRKSFESGDMLTALDSARQNSQSDDTPKLILAAAEGEEDRDPRFGIGGNHPPPEELIPERLQRSPAGPAVQFLDNLLDITEPGDEANLAVATLQMRALLHAIREVDPNYVYESFEPPGGLAGMSWQGRANVIRGLQADLAAAIYKVRGDVRPLQNVTYELMQRTTNAAYDEAVKKYNAGDLDERLPRQLAIGRYVDGEVRKNLRRFYDSLGISTDPGSAIRVNRRAYDTSDSPPSYRVPDARVGNLAFDVSLEAKKPSKDQIRDFFGADFRPAGVVIVRPNQLRINSSYIIWRRNGD